MNNQTNNTKTSEVSDAMTTTELNSLVNIMAFFDWDTFKKFETLDYNDGDELVPS